MGIEIIVYDKPTMHRRPLPFVRGGDSPLSATQLLFAYDLRKGQSDTRALIDGSGSSLSYTDPSTQLLGYLGDLSPNNRPMVALANTGVRCDFMACGSRGVPVAGQAATGTAKKILHEATAEIDLGNTGFWVFVVGYHVVRGGTTNRPGWSVNGKVSAWDENYHEYRESAANVVLAASVNNVTANAGPDSIATLAVRPAVWAYKYTSGERLLYVNGYTTTASAETYAASFTLKNWGMGMRATAPSTYFDTANNEYLFSMFAAMRGDTYTNGQGIALAQYLGKLFNVQGV